MANTEFHFENANITGSQIAGEIYNADGFFVSNGEKKFYKAELIKEIKELQIEAESKDNEVLSKLQDLQRAIEQNNKKGISSLIRELSVGTAASFIASFAGSALKAFLGLG